MAEIELGSLYEFNQEMYKQVIPLDPIFLNKKFKEIACSMKNEYYMLLNRENADYTVFKINSADSDKIASELAETLYNRGSVIDLETKEDGAVEFWIKDFEGECKNYYLFDYSFGIVEVK